MIFQFDSFILGVVIGVGIALLLCWIYIDFPTRRYAKIDYPLSPEIPLSQQRRADV